MSIFNNSSSDWENPYTKVSSEVKRLFSLEVENLQLIFTEKLTLLFGRLALVAVCFVVGATALVFLSMSVADFLLRGLAPCWTYLIIAAFYILIIIIAAAFRRKLIIDPIARFISRVILAPPSADKKEGAITITPVNPETEEE